MATKPPTRNHIETRVLISPTLRFEKTLPPACHWAQAFHGWWQYMAIQLPERISVWILLSYSLAIRSSMLLAILISPLFKSVGLRSCGIYLCKIYSPVIQDSDFEHCQCIYRWFAYETWWCSIVMLCYASLPQSVSRKHWWSTLNDLGVPGCALPCSLSCGWSGPLPAGTVSLSMTWPWAARKPP